MAFSAGRVHAARSSDVMSSPDTPVIDGLKVALSSSPRLPSQMWLCTRTRADGIVIFVLFQRDGRDVTCEILNGLHLQKVSKLPDKSEGPFQRRPSAEHHVRLEKMDYSGYSSVPMDSKRSSRSYTGSTSPGFVDAFENTQHRTFLKW
jgi:hypothetical protein